jgi:hypothetical protein
MKAIASIVGALFTVVSFAGCAVSVAPEGTSSTSSDLVSPIIGGDAGCAGVGSVICLNGGQWDPELCRCVPPPCCPRGWDMASCEEANGTTGLNCHNPELACPSSLACGGGCDFAVTGRCPVCDPIKCPAGESFSTTLCECVPVGCTTAAQCSGPLPQICELCGDGGAACAHWSCVAGQCEIAICQ